MLFFMIIIWRRLIYVFPLAHSRDGVKKPLTIFLEYRVISSRNKRVVIFNTCQVSRKKNYTLEKKNAAKYVPTTLRTPSNTIKLAKNNLFPSLKYLSTN